MTKTNTVLDSKKSVSHRKLKTMSFRDKWNDQLATEEVLMKGFFDKPKPKWKVW